MTAIARFTYRYALWVIGVWILAAVVANIPNSFVPQLERVAAVHDQPFLPSGAASSIAVRRSAAAFSQTPTDNVGYVVLERDGPLNEHDRAFYDQLLAALRNDSRHVIEVVDWWGTPATADAALSSDHHVATAIVRLSGMLGTSQGGDSIIAARSIVARLPAPNGLHIYVTGPGASMVDASAAINRQTVAVAATAVVALLVLLLVVYRSVITAMVPLVSVGLALAVARPIVAVLGRDNVIGVSLFSVMFGAVVVLGAGAGFAILLIGRYRERRRRNAASAATLADAYRAAAPVILGAALILAVAMGCLSFSRFSVLRNTGSPCAIGAFTAALAALTLTPALIALADRTRLLNPRRQRMSRRSWRNGVTVVRSPGPVLAGSAILLLVLALPLSKMRIAWDEASAAPVEAESSRGYQAVDHHFAANELLPDAVTIETDHDIRNSAGLIAVEEITGAIMTLPGVRMVQSASRLNGSAPQQASLTPPSGAMALSGPMVNIGDQLDEASAQFASQQTTLTDLDSATDEMVSALDGLQNGLQHGTAGLGQVSSATRQMQGATTKLRAAIGVFSQIVAPVTGALAAVPGCSENQACHVVQDLTQWADVVADGSAKVANGLGEIADGLAESGGALGGLPIPGADTDALNGLGGQVQQARAAAEGLKKLLNGLGTPIRELPGVLRDLAALFHGGPDVGLNVALKALGDPQMRHVVDNFLSPNGRAMLLLVYGDGRNWAGEDAGRASAIMAVIRGATKDGPVRPTAIELAGVGPAIGDLHVLLRDDLTVLVGIALAVIFAIVSLLLSSPAAGLVVLASAGASYVSAVGVSAVIWQRLLGHDVCWSALAFSCIALVAVCCGHNLHLARRTREELLAGPHIGIVRAFVATGGVGITIGIVFGTTVFALVGCSVLSLAQIGVIVGVGAILNTFVIRSFALPAMMALLGSRFWWPLRFDSD